MGNNQDNKQNGKFQSFQTFSGKSDLLAKVIEFFPYPIEVYTPDGITVLVNKAMLAEYHAVSPEAIIGKYNIFEDPTILASGQLHVLKRAFQGETVFFPDVRVPLEEISKQYGVCDLDVKAIYQDITVFPIFNEDKQVIYVAALLVNRRVYRGKDGIEKAKEYMESNWLNGYDAGKTAQAAFLSKAHFTKLFKKHTGVTPHDYYINYKINKIKEKLLDTNLSVAQAFVACNMDYNGHSAKIFKEKTGVSPSAYRKISG